ncbi:MAG: TVP38/TMEM64 family protein [Holophagales bacterium]|nr:TVP38/TMEM64 family protein [Holophagales bacterium]
MAASSPRFAGLNRAIEKEGGQIVALVRLSPLFPFTVVNYLFGLTPVRTLSYVLASWVACSRAPPPASTSERRSGTQLPEPIPSRRRSSSSWALPPSSPRSSSRASRRRRSALRGPGPAKSGRGDVCKRAGGCRRIMLPAR